MDANLNTPTKETIYNLFYAFIDEKPGLDPADYGNGIAGFRLYRNEANRIAKMRDGAFKELEKFKSFPLEWDVMQDALKFAFSGRLSVSYVDGKGWGIHYTAGQYYPTEYRLAATAVLKWYNNIMSEKFNVWTGEYYDNAK